ncbi:MAG: alpha/beta fold hydrolase [Candidatus Manganitrophaceae bacterium]
MKRECHDLKERLVPFTAGDGLSCNLIQVRGERAPSKGPVLLVHGAGVRANIFRPPTETNFVEYLVDHGYDVWLENWRASIDLAPNHWTLDQAALYDHPEAVKTVVRETGAREIKAVIHCQGSTSFTMSAIAGLVPQVKMIVSNAVSLHPVVPDASLFKSKLALPLVSRMTDFLNPQWGLHAPTLPAKLISRFVEMTHHECDNAVCKQVSFTYGTGFPALWRHENLNEATHEWLKQEFAHVPLRFFKQMAVCLEKGNLVAVEGKKELPEDFAAQPPRTEARFAFFAGGLNRCFLPVSQEKSFDYFNTLRKDYHALYVLPTYSHLDIFMGKNAANDVFPLMLAELDRNA